MKSLSILTLLLLPSTALAAGDGPNWTAYGFHLLNLTILIFVIKMAAGKAIKSAVSNRAKNIQTHLNSSEHV